MNCDPQLEWTWVAGLSNPDGYWGNKGMPHPANTPPAMRNAAGVTDSHNNLWLFGGGRDDTFTHNTLWHFNGTLWTWKSGSKDPNALPVWGDKGLPDEGNTPGSRYKAMMWVDKNNTFYLFGGQTLGKNDYFLFQLLKFEKNWVCVALS